ncbi:MAG: DUF362 domain-containing protein, partial [Methanobacterium sp.]|nr:DUF362 domain-containing protein [Methanobacterium sp.]
MEKTTISIAKCNSYDSKELQEALNKCLNQLGGLKSFINKKDTVLLKPNMLLAARPDEQVTTHPNLVESLARMVLDEEATPILGDCPGGSFQDIEKFWKSTGYRDISKKLGIELVNFESAGSYICKRSGKKYPISRAVLDADAIINLPKIKTHSLTLFTCAIKNMYGTVPGFTKADIHRKNPKPSEFAESVVDIYALTKPTLNLVDGVWGMEGPGPSGGDPRKLGMILASTDGVALDTYICYLLKMPAHKIPSTRIATKQGLGEGKLENMDILGWNPPLVDDFNWPSHIAYSVEMIPSSLARAIMKFWWARPSIKSDKCKNCNICVDSCPVQAMRPGVLVPEFNY